MKAKETIDYQIKTCWLAISKMYNTEAVKHDITMSIGYVLLNIDLEKGTQATKIAPKLGLEVRSLTRTLKNMEDQGLIYKTNDINDRRSVHIKLTEKGIKKREIARKTVLNFNHKIQQAIAPDKLQTFFEVMDEINEVIESGDKSRTRETNNHTI